MEPSNGLIVTALTRAWPDRTVSATFSVPEGGSLAVLGPSGSGKTTLLRMIAGLVQADSGTVSLGGVDITRLPPGKRRIGMVFQDAALFSHLTVEGNIAYGLAGRGTSRVERREAVDRWLGLLGMEGFQHRRVDTLSGGERQRVALARTLAVDPALVLFDEPLSSLDASLRSRLVDELRARQRELGYTALYVTHDESEASRLADGIILLG